MLGRQKHRDEVDHAAIRLSEVANLPRYPLLIDPVRFGLHTPVAQLFLRPRPALPSAFTLFGECLSRLPLGQQPDLAGAAFGRGGGPPRASAVAASLIWKASGRPWRGRWCFFWQLPVETLNNANAPYEQRFQAAKEAAPYVHPRLAAIQVQKLAEPQHSLDLTKLSDEELIFFEKILAKAQIVHPDDSSPKLIEHEPSV